MKSYDVVVAGLGGIGSATLYHLASRGLKVLGVDPFPPPHALGSSHGETRMIRTAYFEHENYVPLLQRAYELWGELEERSKKKLYEEVGVLEVGVPDGPLISGVKRAADIHKLSVDEWSHAEARKRYPQFAYTPEQVVLYEPRAGYLLVEDCVSAHLAEAKKAGATLSLGSRLTRWSDVGDGARISLGNETVDAGALVITAGPWAGELLHSLGIPLQVTRQPMFWFPAEPALWTETPCFAYELEQGFFYGIPALGRSGIKAALHTGGAAVPDPSRVDRGLDEASLQPVKDFLERHALGVRTQPYRHSVCLYTMSPDGHFIIDQLAGGRVSFAAGFSGHGFKFATVMGEILADLATGGKTEHPIEFLRASRFVET